MTQLWWDQLWWGLITKGDEAAYREEVQRLTVVLREHHSPSTLSRGSRLQGKKKRKIRQQFSDLKISKCNVAGKTQATTRKPTARPSALTNKWKIRCMVYQNPSTWSKHLVWVEYVHNSLSTPATGFSPFHCVYGYQPPVFPDNELEVSVPSAHAMI